MMDFLGASIFCDTLIYTACILFTITILGQLCFVVFNFENYFIFLLYPSPLFVLSFLVFISSIFGYFLFKSSLFFLGLIGGLLSLLAYKKRPFNAFSHARLITMPGLL